MLLSSSHRKYPPFPLLSYFSVVVCLRCLLHHIPSLIAYTFRQNREFVFIIIVQFMMNANIRIRFGLQIVLVCLYSTPSHYHHCANLSEGIELIKCLSDIFCRVCKIKHILSVIHYTICGTVCLQFTHFSSDDWENIYILCLIIIIKSEVWTITHCLGLGHETMVSAVCLFIFLLVVWIGHIKFSIIYFDTCHTCFTFIQCDDATIKMPCENSAWKETSTSTILLNLAMGFLEAIFCYTQWTSKLGTVFYVYKLSPYTLAE